MANGHHTIVPNGMAGRCRSSGQSHHQGDNHAVHWFGMLIVAGLTLVAIQPACTNAPDSDELITAAYQGDTTKVKALLTKGFDVNRQSINGATALFVAAQYGHTEVVQILLTNKADMNLQRNDGMTALIWAALNGQTEVVQLLLANKADVHVQASDGATALFVAAQYGHTEVVQILLASQAYVNVQANNGDTPLSLANTNRIAELLKAAGATH